MHPSLRMYTHACARESAKQSMHRHLTFGVLVVRRARGSIHDRIKLPRSSLGCRSSEIRRNMHRPWFTEEQQNVISTLFYFCICCFRKQALSRIPCLVLESLEWLMYKYVILSRPMCKLFADLLSLVEKEHMVPVHLGHWSRLLNRDQLLGTNIGPGSSTNRDR
jgi:hypothetical protein